MANELKKAIIKATGKSVEVYRLNRGTGEWCNYNDCKTVYKEKDLRFIPKNPKSCT